jgi:hypothetical protein
MNHSSNFPSHENLSSQPPVCLCSIGQLGHGVSGFGQNNASADRYMVRVILEVIQREWRRLSRRLNPWHIYARVLNGFC